MSTTATKPQVTATGRSQKVYTFNEYPFGTEFRPIGAVYVVLKERQPIYVGQTGDLSVRFVDHHKHQCMRRHGATVICILAVSSEAERLRIEQDLLDNYDWPCND